MVGVNVNRAESPPRPDAHRILSAEQVERGMPSAMAAAAGPWTLMSCMLLECCAQMSDQVLRMHAAAAEHWEPKSELTVRGSPVCDGELLQQDLQRVQHMFMVWRAVQTVMPDYHSSSH